MQLQYNRKSLRAARNQVAHPQAYLRPANSAGTSPSKSSETSFLLCTMILQLFYASTLAQGYFTGAKDTASNGTRQHQSTRVRVVNSPPGSDFTMASHSTCHLRNKRRCPAWNLGFSVCHRAMALPLFCM